MALEEMKSRIDEITGQIAGLEQAENNSYAELGRKVLPNVAEDSEYSDFVARIKEITGKKTGLADEQAGLEAEYRRRLELCTCFTCKTVNTEGATFCEECGAKLGVKPREYCEACGHMNSKEQKFCGECGTKLG